MSMTEDLVARIAALDRRLAAVEAKERPLVLRGRRDDFMGKSIDIKYTQMINGAGSTISLRNQVGGVIRMQAGGGATRSALLELGDGAGGYEPLDADIGWRQIAYCKLDEITDIYAGLYAHNFGGLEIVFTGLRTDIVANNWIIRAHDGVAFAHTDTGVVADTNYHWHEQSVYPDPVTGGHQIDYLLDGALIGSQTVRVPTVQMAPGLLCYTVAGVVTRQFRVNHWTVISK